MDFNALPRFSTLVDTTAILGAGFSVPAGVPPTSKISEEFLTFNRDLPTPSFIQKSISDHLRTFWKEAFGYSNGSQVPSFEDHFTMLDLSANSGHNLGRYTPATLRALRRLSIHRVFEILDVSFQSNPSITKFLKVLSRSPHSSVVSLNWDIVVENHLREFDREFRYPVPGRFLYADTPMNSNAFPIIKLHGSTNWHYCDTCQTSAFGDPGVGKTALHNLAFIEPNDFRVLGEDEAFVNSVAAAKMFGTPCPTCHTGKMTARVATFSYSKAFDFYLFHTAWNAALQELRTRHRWIFIGYSLPEADFTFKHLLKTAQMASPSAPKQIIVVTKESGTEVRERYQRFFGIHCTLIFSSGLEEWVSNHIVVDD